jgi:hypothetical protein
MAGISEERQSLKGVLELRPGPRHKPSMPLRDGGAGGRARLVVTMGRLDVGLPRRPAATGAEGLRAASDNLK